MNTDELDQFITETAWPETAEMDNIHDILNHVVKRCMEQFPALQERTSHVERARLALHALDKLDLFEPHVGNDEDFYHAALLAAFVGLCFSTNTEMFPGDSPKMSTD